jgi:hypothetical protein
VETSFPEEKTGSVRRYLKGMMGWKEEMRNDWAISRMNIEHALFHRGKTA